MTEFRVAAGSTDITPDQSFGSLPIAGHPGRSKPSQGVADPLEANAVLVRCGDAAALFLCFDLLYVGADLRDAICGELADRISPEWIFTSASHTHFAPATDKALPRLGLVSEAYVQFVIRRAIELARRLLESNTWRVSARHASGTANHSVNRRRLALRPRIGIPPLKYRSVMRPDWDGPRDETIHLLRFGDESGNVAAICWSYACHPVCSPDFDLLSADFPGVVRRALRDRYGSIPVLYWQGFSGDIRPPAIQTPGVFGGWRSPRFGKFTKSQWAAWSGGLAECVLRVLDLPGRAIAGLLSATRRTVPMELFGPSAGNRRISVHEIGLGPSMILFGVSAEPFCDYGRLVSKLRHPMEVIPVGCIDSVPGYLPTDSAVPQGGYEVEGFMRLFNVSGRFRSEVSRTFLTHIVQPHS